MHDPYTQAFEIRWPWGGKPSIGGYVYRAPVVTIWHVDPESNGTDDSCNWSGFRESILTAKEKALADRLIDCEHDNVRSWFRETDRTEMRWMVRRMFCLLKSKQRRWWKHPRWHFWHWSVQIHPLQTLKRWLFSRCAGCGRRFPWGYAPVSHNWNSDGPRWFRSERGVYHHECDSSGVPCSAKTEARVAS